MWEIKKNDESGIIEAKLKESVEDEKKIEDLRNIFRNEANGRLKYKDTTIAKFTNVFYTITEGTLGVSSLDSSHRNSQLKHKCLFGIIGNLRFLNSSFIKLEKDPRDILSILTGNNTVELDTKQGVEKYKNITIEFPLETNPYKTVNLKFIKFFWSSQRSE